MKGWLAIGWFCFAFTIPCSAFLSLNPSVQSQLNIRKSSICREAGKSSMIFMTLPRREVLIGGLLLATSAPTLKRALAADVSSQIASGLLELSNQEPYEEKAIALLSDGGPLFAAAKAAIEELGGISIEIDPKKPYKEIQKLYFEGNCIGAFVPDQGVIKNMMQGRGCECERCGFGETPTGPSWFVVLNKTDKTGQQIQEDANISGRECTPNGMCIQIGKATPVYTLPELYKYRGEGL